MNFFRDGMIVVLSIMLSTTTTKLKHAVESQVFSEGYMGLENYHFVLRSQTGKDLITVDTTGKMIVSDSLNAIRLLIKELYSLDQRKLHQFEPQRNFIKQ